MIPMLPQGTYIRRKLGYQNKAHHGYIVYLNKAAITQQQSV